MNNKYFFTLYRIAFFNSILFIFGFFKYASFFGYSKYNFSFSTIFAPMIGFYAGLPCVTLIYLSKFLFRGFFLGSEYFLNPLHFRLPTLCAAAYWAKGSFMFRFLVPLLCIALFVIHPVGYQAFFYSFYWFIPLVLYYCAPQKNIVVQALASSFIAHAVGSVLWLYFTPAINSEIFITLIPIVFIERLIIASGMILIDAAICIVKGLFFQDYRSIFWYFNDFRVNEIKI